MFWVLIYIATNFLAPIPPISAGIDDFIFRFSPKSTNGSRRISRKSLNRLKPALRPAKAGTLAKAGPPPPGQRFRISPSIHCHHAPASAQHRPPRDSSARLSSRAASLPPPATCSRAIPHACGPPAPPQPHATAPLGLSPARPSPPARSPRTHPPTPSTRSPLASAALSPSRPRPCPARTFPRAQLTPAQHPAPPQLSSKLALLR
jgi:hypothetical protein